MSKLLLIIATIIMSTISVEYVYTIHYVRSFRDDLLQRQVGCGQNIAYSTYLHPKGLMDALSLMTNSGSYGKALPNCAKKQTFAVIFGNAQDYSQLLNQNAGKVAQSVHQTVGHNFNKIIINWKYELVEDVSKAKQWLQSFIGQLKNNGLKPYLKAPASYFCYDVKGQNYLLDISNADSYIVQMYGEKVGQYISFQDIFTHQSTTNSEDKSKYPKDNCPKFPSLLNLQNNYAKKQFFLGKTLQKQEAGYVGSRINQFLQKAQGIYQKLVFLDSYPEEIIQF